MASSNANEFTKLAWNQNAEFWDNRMGEGNDFVNILCWPNLERLLCVHKGMRVLDIACGNGLTSRRLAALGAQVTAFDFSSEMIAFAKTRSAAVEGDIDYRVLDATDECALLTLGEHAFDAALSNMALFDMAEIEPLFRALRRLLRPGGVFVFSVIHPCFNSPHMAHAAEKEDREGTVITTYYLKIYNYITPAANRAAAIEGQPHAQLVFHRPLQVLLGTGFNAGFMMDALIEPAFPEGHRQGKALLGWNGQYHEFPPVLICRMRVPG
ncbi:MAG: class I SAM-dependent methyltransferase [Chloroflexi bacterium]|nr:class I SAM-dependent methyltransferase [Chloroflexota bacterium]